MSQTAAILKHLEKGYKITPIEALNRFGCFRLAARIADLRRMGYKIMAENEKSEGQRYARYWMP